MPESAIHEHTGVNPQVQYPSVVDQTKLGFAKEVTPFVCVCVSVCVRACDFSLQYENNWEKDVLG